MRVPSLLFQTRKEPSLLSITDYRIAVIIGEEKRGFLIRGTVPLIIFILHNFCITPNDTPVSLES